MHLDLFDTIIDVNIDVGIDIDIQDQLRIRCGVL